MTESKACKVLLLSALLLSMLLDVAQPEGTWYQVTSSELRQLETLWQTSETNRQKWESQARSLRIKAESLQQTSETLNSQLQTERETLAALRKSFNAYATAQEQTLAKKESALQIERAETERIRKQRNIIALILAGIALVLVVFIGFRIVTYTSPKLFRSV